MYLHMLDQPTNTGNSRQPIDTRVWLSNTVTPLISEIKSCTMHNVLCTMFQAFYNYYISCNGMALGLSILNLLALLPASHFFHLKTTCPHDSCYAYNAHSLLIAQHSRRNMHQHLINLVHISIH